ncbi:hypothetical protein [Sphingobacterium sp. CZ-2]|uniref:hypothetical protein n=1 Tax=Sphingobacterium sp. CZ-2 TaxID=2557994 RepID=UPI0010706724|nr:hypothetical protein [Sphingobacterium sp. CZ-2]QBR13585.1 hypothetical protein E3D81_15930 [Sphingobacterium sp. CZ-2]
MAFIPNLSGKDSSSNEYSLKDAEIYQEKNLAAYDSVTSAKNSLIRKIIRPFAKKFFEFREQELTLTEIIQKFVMVFMHTLPKALFFYLPIFALILWVFHDKKKWWYYEHWVFTLHYFSFLLLIVTFFLLLNIVTRISESYGWQGHAKNWLYTIGIIYYLFLYFA